MKLFNESQARVVRDTLNAQAQRLGITPRVTGDVLADVDTLTAAIAAHGEPRRTAGHATEQSASKAGGTTGELLQRYAALQSDNERADFVSAHSEELQLAILVGDRGIVGIDAAATGETDAVALVAAYEKLTTDAERSAFLHKHGAALEAAIINSK